MLIKVRDFRDPVIKEITKAIEENAFWFDKNIKKRYTRVNPDKQEVKLGEYTSYRSVENNNYVFSINAKDYTIEITLKDQEDLDENHFFSNYKIRMTHTKDYFFSYITKPEESGDLTHNLLTDLVQSFNYKEE